jgi:hypothetical protein
MVKQYWKSKLNFKIDGVNLRALEYYASKIGLSIFIKKEKTDILKNIIADYTDKDGNNNFIGSIFVRSGFYQLEDALDISSFDKLNLVGEDKYTVILSTWAAPSRLSHREGASFVQTPKPSVVLL